MSSTYGENLKLSIFGQSHGSAIGMTLDGIPAGLKVDLDALEAFLRRRAPGQWDFSTPRAEEDKPEFLAGFMDGYTCGAPIAAVIANQNAQSKDYDDLRFTPRPGHGDYTAHVKYGGYADYRGGGHFSGRLTAPICIAGGLCKQWLAQMGIQIQGHIVSIAGILDSPTRLDFVNPDIQSLNIHFPVVSSKAREDMAAKIIRARDKGDSVGGEVECFITGVPAGIGEPMFGGIESKIAQIVYGIPAVKSVEFGLGSLMSEFRGSMVNDPFVMEDGTIKTATNYCGGILGGISTGMPIIFKASIKPTPSIATQQHSVNLQTMENTTLQIQGRHDPCIVPRAVPVLEAAAAIAIYDLILGNTQTERRK